MEKDTKPNNIEKFLKLESEKQGRILNAAMKEFQYGYKKASTDIIVKEAGISKGLLFHYFGTKEQLLFFLLDYAAGLVQRDFHDMLNRNNQDILEAFWQRALLKRDLTSQYPFLYEFLNGVFAHWEDTPGGEETMASFEAAQRDFNESFYAECNLALFREDIDYKTAISVIMVTMDGVFEQEDANTTAGKDSESYERFLETLRSYVDLFRQCFYK